LSITERSSGKVRVHGFAGAVVNRTSSMLFEHVGLRRRKTEEESEEVG
jgi:hypothetical protein